MLTETAIKAAQPPASGTATLWDASLRNFGLRISQGGAKTFIVLIESGRRQAIGRYPHITLSQARTEAKKILAEKTLGHIRPKHVAFDDAVAHYLEECEKRNRPRTVIDYGRLLRRHFAFGRSSIGEIKPTEIVRRLSKLNDRPGEKHHAFTAGRVFFRWCVRQRYLERSPFENTKVPLVASSRDRVLNDAELATVYRAAIDCAYPFGPIVRLLILTGQRRGEIGALRWDWFDFEHQTITLPNSITKNKCSHTFPLGKAVRTLLADIPRFGEHIFPATRDHVRGNPTSTFNGWGKSTGQFRKTCAIEHFTLHDLRRTFSSGMAALGVSQVVVEKLINHKSGGTLSPVAAIYNRYNYMDEQRAAIAAWEAKLFKLITPS